MRNRLRIKSLLLLPFIIMTSCNRVSSSLSSESSEITIPTDYEIDETVTNKNGGVYYEVFVRSFADSNGDGQGDLKGIENKIEYFAALGVKGLWLTPINPSPSYHGYDVSDYKGINPDFGTLADFDSLILKAKEYNIDIIIDLVLNHSSTAHPWYLEGRQNFRDGNFNENDPTNKANWYDFYWSGTDVLTNSYFGASMPEFLLDNTALRAEIESISQFWIDRGVKGFRLDATSHFYTTSIKNIAFLSWFQDVVKSQREDAYIVGEAWINSFENQKYYYEGNDSFFNFEASNVSGYIIDKITSSNGTSISTSMAKNYKSLYEVNEDGVMAMFLTNHDMDRSSQMFIFNFEQRQKLAASIYLLTPGHPFMYYGEEIALKGSRMTNATDANRRLPMIWQKTSDSERTDNPPLTDYPMTNQVKDGVKEQLASPFSLLNHYRKVISIRNSYPWLTNARLENLTLGNNYIASLKLTSRDGNNLIHVIHNVASESQTIDLSRYLKEYEVVIKHDIFSVGQRAVLDGSNLTLPAYSSVVLERK